MIRFDLIEFARKLNEMARAVVIEDGTHASMFFLVLPDGSVKTTLFDPAEGPVGEIRGRAISEGVREYSAQAVAFISEAWSAPWEDVPEEGAAGDVARARDVLLVAATDRLGTNVVIETPIIGGADGVITLGDSTEYGDEYIVTVLDGARDAWRVGA